MCVSCSSNTTGALYSSQLYSCAEDEFRRIVVGPKIVAHHTPWLVLAALDNIVDNPTAS